MKESDLFLGFAKRHLLALILPIILGCLISVYFYSSEPARTKITQSFKTEYSLEDVTESIALTDQAVAELRLQQFDLGFENSKAVIYKPAPLAVTIEILSEDRNVGYALLLKETEYLRKNFSAGALREPQLSLVEPNLLKYLLTGALIGFLAGLIFSLSREYLKNY